MTYDVAIVGGSLAGSAAAIALARAGARVVVLEKSRFPRPRICGEFLSPAARPLLSRLGVLDAVLLAGAETIDRFAVVRTNGSRVTAPLPAPVLSLSRERLDTLLYEAALALGAEYRFGSTVLSIEGNLADGFRLAGPGLELHARVVLGAWGRYAPLDGKLGRDFYRAPASLFGFKKHLHCAGAEFLKSTVVLHLFKGGYLGLSRVEGGIVNLAALARPEIAQEAHHDFDRLLVRLRSESAALEEDLSPLEAEPGPPLVSEPVHLGRRSTSSKEILFAGDAAGVLDPYTGAGMWHALATGEGASIPIRSFLEDALTPRELIDHHDRTLRRLAGRRFFWARLFRPFFNGSSLSNFILPAASPLAGIAARLTSR